VCFVESLASRERLTESHEPSTLNQGATMKLWRVILSLHLKGTTNEVGIQPYSYTVHPCTFYVHAVCASDARTMAIALVSASVSPHDEYRTSGSVIAVDGNLDPLDPSCVAPSYDSWNDLSERAA
jgi:hypothetical protein